MSASPLYSTISPRIPDRPDWQRVTYRRIGATPSKPPVGLWRPTIDGDALGTEATYHPPGSTLTLGVATQLHPRPLRGVGVDPTILFLVDRSAIEAIMRERIAGPGGTEPSKNRCRLIRRGS
jgi:hypothetical protein